MADGSVAAASAAIAAGDTTQGEHMLKEILAQQTGAL